MPSGIVSRRSLSPSRCAGRSRPRPVLGQRERPLIWAASCTSSSLFTERGSDVDGGPGFRGACLGGTEQYARRSRCEIEPETNAGRRRRGARLKRIRQSTRRRGRARCRLERRRWCPLSPADRWSVPGVGQRKFVGDMRLDGETGQDRAVAFEFHHADGGFEFPVGDRNVIEREPEPLRIFIQIRVLPCIAVGQRFLCLAGERETRNANNSSLRCWNKS